MVHKQPISTKRIVLAALMAALTVAGSALRITLPLQIAGTTSFHLGNIMCALSGIMLGPWLGGLAAGLGSALYDMTNPLYISECWITFLTKGAYGLAAGYVAWFGSRNWGHLKAAIATTAGALTYVVLYFFKCYFYDGRFLGGLTPAASLLAFSGKIPATIFNAVIAILCAPILAMSIRRALEQNRITLD